jgi:predicted nucleic acid-binding protein
MVARKDWTRR